MCVCVHDAQPFAVNMRHENRAAFVALRDCCCACSPATLTPYLTYPPPRNCCCCLHRLEEMNERRGAMVAKLKGAEKELAGLEGRKVEAEAYLAKQAERLRANMLGHTISRAKEQVQALPQRSALQHSVHDGAPQRHLQPLLQGAVVLPSLVVLPSPVPSVPHIDKHHSGPYKAAPADVEGFPPHLAAICTCSMCAVLLHVLNAG